MLDNRSTTYDIFIKIFLKLIFRFKDTDLNIINFNCNRY